MRSYCVYILQCFDRSYYIGVTNNVELRLLQHQEGVDKYCYTYDRRPLELVYVEEFDDVNDAIRREKQLKMWSRKKKGALIEGRMGDLEEYAKKKKIC